VRAIILATGGIGAGLTNTVKYVEIAGTISMSLRSLFGQTEI
jgi:hypothetical protein